MKKYIAVLKNSFIKIITERETIFIWSLSSSISLIGIVTIWLACDQTVIGGFTKPQLITYYLIIFFLEQIIGWWVFWNIRHTIREGKMANYLLKPISYIKYLFLHELTYKSVNLVTHIIVGSILLFFLHHYIELFIDLGIILKLIPAILIGIGINFLTHFAMGCVTFYITESQFLADIQWISNLAFSGKLLPLVFLPDQMYSILKYNPFRYTFSLPTEILFGQLQNKELLINLFIGLLWVSIFFALSYLLWTRGLKRYSAYGS